MNPIFLQVGQVKIFWFGVMMALGCFAGLISWTLLGRREGRDFAFASDLLFWLMIPAIVGARLTYLAANWEYYVSRAWEIWRIDRGGLIYYGGMAAATAAVVVFARVRKQNWRRLFDFVATALPLAHAFGRVGCFLNGCCHGIPCDGFLGARFPRNSPPWHRQLDQGLIDAREPLTLPAHPVQLYEAAFSLALYALLIVIYRRQKRAGTTTAAYLILYPFGRFLIEFLRGDERLPLLGLTAAQVASLCLMAAGIVWMTAGRRKPEAPARTFHTPA
ncbi:MAG: prolipoprotein diacylglyceryl transferase [Verrucomicrobiota bacterium]|nr:prolipoprotein diacylglyceryl transferase [Verrucomicrobiota bacterium]